MNGSCTVALAEKQLSDEEGAEQKEDWYSIRADHSDVEEDRIMPGIGWNIIHAVKIEDKKKGKEA